MVFFGSARTKPEDVALDLLANAERELARSTGGEEQASLEADVRHAKRGVRSSQYYTRARELARRLTAWDMERMGDRRYYIATGGGPGIMEAANRGAADVEGGRSVGLGISLPFEEDVNQWVTPELAFEFHYFFTRKYWFMYLAKAMVIFPGGFGTMDEFFELLTLRQTQKIKKPMPTVLFGTEYWSSVINVPSMVEWGTISEKDLDLFYTTDSVDEAFDYIVKCLIEHEAVNGNED